MTTLGIEEKLEKFFDGIDGEMFFSTGNNEQDFNIITATIKSNGGYWAGERYRYFFDEEFNLTDVQERRFGV